MCNLAGHLTAHRHLVHLRPSRELPSQSGPQDRCTSITGTGFQTLIAYDGLGRRKRIVELSGGTTNADRWFVWDGARLAEERDAAGSVVQRFFPEATQGSTSVEPGAHRQSG